MGPWAVTQLIIVLRKKGRGKIWRQVAMYSAITILISLWVVSSISKMLIQRIVSKTYIINNLSLPLFLYMNNEKSLRKTLWQFVWIQNEFNFNFPCEPFPFPQPTCEFQLNKFHLIIFHFLFSRYFRPGNFINQHSMNQWFGFLNNEKIELTVNACELCTGKVATTIEKSFFIIIKTQTSLNIHQLVHG